MDMKKLLAIIESKDSMKSAEKAPTGPRFTGYWKGTDSHTPGDKMVGGAEEYDESILKDLSKGPKAKTVEEELAEAFAQFNEEDLGVEPKRPSREGARHHRGHEPHPRYKTVKADGDYKTATGGKVTKTPTGIVHKGKKYGGEEQDFDYWEKARDKLGNRKHHPVDIGSEFDILDLDEAGNPAQQAAIAIAMKKAGKKPKNEQEELNQPRRPEVIDDLPKTPQDPNRGTVVKDFNRLPNDPNGPKRPIVTDEGAEQDPIVARVVKQMRPGLKNLDMGNEAFLYFAYELGKQRARDAWSDYLPAIRSAYEQGLSEGWESGPEEYEEPYDDADDAYDRQRQEKIDTEAEREWAKLPKVSTYQCTGRGANMEPNQKFGPEFDTLEKALEYRAKIMKDPKTPHPEHIGINTLTRVTTDKTNETVEGGGGVKDLKDYTEKREYILDQLTKAEQKDNWPWFKQALFDLNRTAKAKGIPVKESRGHDIVKRFLKDRGAWDNNPFAKDDNDKKWVVYNNKTQKSEMAFSSRKEAEDHLIDHGLFGSDKSIKHKSELPVEEDMAPPQSGTQAPPTQSGSATPAINLDPNSTDPKIKQQTQSIMQATQAVKSASGSTTPVANLIKSMNTAAQGKALGPTDSKILEPINDIVVQALKDPKVGQAFKNVAQAAKQSEQAELQKQKQQPKA